MHNTNENSSVADVTASSTLAGRSFNIRVSFDALGVPVIGFVHGLYEMSESITEIRRIPEADHVFIAKALGIRASSVHCSVNRALRRCTDTQQEDDLKVMEAVSC